MNRRRKQSDTRPDLPYTMKLPGGRVLYVEVPGWCWDRDRSGEVVFTPLGVRFLDRVRVMAMKMPSAPSPGYIRTLREALGLTQEQFGRRVGVDKMTVWRWERGQMKPGSQSVKALETLRHKAAGKGVLLAG